MNSKKRILALLMCICMIFTLLPFSVFAENAENGNRGGTEEVVPGGDTGGTQQSDGWNIDVSKNASEWRDGYKTNVTLSVPSAETKLDTDIVFVLDVSDCADAVVNKVQPLVAKLSGVKNKDNIKVGVVVFRGSAAKMFDEGFVDVNTAVGRLNELAKCVNEAVKNAVQGKENKEAEKAVIEFLGLNNGANFIKNGSNLHSGLLAAQTLLQSGSAKPDRKYLINITDGMTYYWNDAAGKTYAIYSDGYNNNKNNLECLFYLWQKAWNIGDGYTLPATGLDWGTYIAGVRDRIAADNNYYNTDIRDLAEKMNKDDVRFPYSQDELKAFNNAGYHYVTGWKDDEYSADNYKAHALGIERSVVECLDTYKAMVDAQYKCYTYNPNYGEDTFPGLFTFELNKLAGVDGSVDFKTIENNILYAVGKGSCVVDKIGADFTLDQDSISVKLDDTKLNSTKVADLKNDKNWTMYFGDSDAATVLTENYRFKVAYNSEGSGTLTWTFSETLSNFEHAQLSYTLELKNIDTTAGTHGQLDLNGDGKIDGTDVAVDTNKAIYTNDEAILHYKATNGDKGTKTFPMPSVAYEIKDWGIKVSKIATALDKDYKTNVTLSVPGKQESLVSEIVFVLDGSSSADTGVVIQSLELLNDLKQAASENGAAVKVCVVKFKRQAFKSDWFDLATQYDAIKTAMEQSYSGGSNIHAGLLAGQAALKEHANVSADRKYLVLISDGSTYLYSKDGDWANDRPFTRSYHTKENYHNDAGGFSEDHLWNPSIVGCENQYDERNVARPTKTSDVAAWQKYLKDVEARNAESNGDAYDYRCDYDLNFNQGKPSDDFKTQPCEARTATNRDMAYYYADQTWQQIKNAGYNAFSIAVEDGSAGAGNSDDSHCFMNYLNEGKSLNFSDIKNDILFAVGAGSTVKDVIGEKFTLDVSTMKLSVGTDELTGKFDKDTNTWSFGKDTNGNARFTAAYDETTRTITWTFNEAVSNFAPVELSYTLKLTKPETKPGTYGQLDLNGDGKIDNTGAAVNTDKALYTNDSAILNPIDSDNHPAVSVPFPKPSVEYTINRHVDPGIYTEITVEITGNSDSVVYDGTEHNVKGYTVKISDPRYTEKDFTFTGKAEASGVNAGSYEMGLKADQFKNTNALFRNVKFIIKADGVLTITPKDLTITAGSKTDYGPNPVTCDKWTVDGLVKGDKVESVKITGSQNVPGSSPNVASDAVIKNAKGEDVTKNYNIKYVDGTLTMLEVLNKEDHFNYIIGTPEGLSMPTANVTRAEVATIFFRLMTDEARANYDSRVSTFSDVANGAWYTRAIATLANAGIIKGDPAGTFRPSDPITRAEMATIIARFGDFKEGGKTFSDISGHWAQKYIELAASNGWINGNPDGTFKPDNNITRAETVAMINRVLGRQTESNDALLPVAQMTNWSDNADTTAWYYRDMQEATNNHKAERVGDSAYEKWTEKLPDIDWASYQI